MTSLFRAISAMALSFCAGGTRPGEPGRDRQRRGCGSRRRHVRQRADHRPHPADRDRPGQAHAPLSLDRHLQQRGGAVDPQCGVAAHREPAAARAHPAARPAGAVRLRARGLRAREAGRHLLLRRQVHADRPALGGGARGAAGQRGRQLGCDRGKAQRRGQTPGRRPDPDRQQAARRHGRAVGQRLQRGTPAIRCWSAPRPYARSCTAS